MIQPIAKECQSQVQNEDWANATETWGSVEEAVERTESTYLDIFFFFFGPFSIESLIIVARKKKISVNINRGFCERQFLQYFES